MIAATPEIEALAESPHPWAFMHSGNLIYRRDMALAIGEFDEAFDRGLGLRGHRLRAPEPYTAGGAIPAYLAGIECYRQNTLNPATTAEAAERFDRRRTPTGSASAGESGYEQFKRGRSRKLSPGIRL